MNTETWLKDLVFVDKECIVMGLGEGLHILEMIREKSFLKIYVVETRGDLIESFKNRYPQLHHVVEIIHLQKAEDIFEHPLMTVSLDKCLSVYAYRDCWKDHQELFTKAHRHLTGRSEESLNLFFQVHGLRKDIRIHDEGGRKYLSFKDLIMLIQEDIPPYLRLNCFRILKELIL